MLTAEEFNRKFEKHLREERKNKFIEEEATKKKSVIQHRTFMINIIMIAMVYLYFLAGGGSELLNIIYIVAAVLLIKLVNVMLAEWDRAEMNFIKRDADLMDTKYCYNTLKERYKKN